jgi:DNA-directed RNA polymerase II subunit RPB7
MFFLKRLKRELQLHPKHFGPKLKAVIRERLIEEVEGASLGKDGYVITVTRVSDEDIGQGLIEDSGYVNFVVHYSAILFCPFKNEVMDAVVSFVNQLGFYADIGPLSVFVSRHAMPEDITTYNSETETWVSDDKEVEIKSGCGVRLRIMGTTVDSTEINAVGTIKGDFLGLISSD